MNEGKVIRDLLDEINEFIGSLNQQGEEFETIKLNLTDSLQAVEEATDWLIEKGTEDPVGAISGATPYLRMLGQLVGGWFLARLAIGARSNEHVGDSETCWTAPRSTATPLIGSKHTSIARGLPGSERRR